MAENPPGNQRIQILGLGVTAFSGICTLLAAMISAGFSLSAALLLPPPSPRSRSRLVDLSPPAHRKPGLEPSSASSLTSR